MPWKQRHFPALNPSSRPASRLGGFPKRHPFEHLFQRAAKIEIHLAARPIFEDQQLRVGGLFLMGESTHEIQSKLEGAEEGATTRVTPSFHSVLIQIALLDLAVPLDSVITAVGLVEEVGIMVAAVMLSVGAMMAFSVGVELLNLRARRVRGDAATLRHSYDEDKPA